MITYFKQSGQYVDSSEMSSVVVLLWESQKTV
jgi:hypothetical protein